MSRNMYSYDRQSNSYTISGLSFREFLVLYATIVRIDELDKRKDGSTHITQKEVEG